MLNREVAPPFRKIDKFEIQKAESGKLANGIPFHLILAGTEPVIRLEFVFQAGHWYEPYNGVSYFTSKSLSLGTASLSASEIENRIALYGAFLDLSSGYDRSTLTLYCLSKHLQSLLPLLKEMIIESSFPDAELDNLKNISLQQYRVNQNKTSFLASAAFRESIFGKNYPYARVLDEEAINNVKREDLLAFFFKNFASADFDIILSGNGEQNFYSLLNETLGTLPARKPVVSPSFSFNNDQNKKILIEKPESVQSSIRMGIPLFPITHPDYFKVNFLIELFGGYFGSRLMKNIREEKGYTYGIGAGIHTLKNAGYVVIATDVNKENTENTIKEIYKEASILKQTAVEEDELTTLKNYLLGSFVSSLSTPFGLADKFKTIYFNNLNYGFYENYIDSIKNISAGDVIDAANRYFPDEMLEAVVGGR